jgi:hypothetical protein
MNSTEPSMQEPDDAAGMDGRMDAIRLKQILGGALTDQELMCLQFEANGFGCTSRPGHEPPTGTRPGR